MWNNKKENSILLCLVWNNKKENSILLCLVWNNKKQGDYIPQADRGSRLTRTPGILSVLSRCCRWTQTSWVPQCSFCLPSHTSANTHRWCQLQSAETWVCTPPPPPHHKLIRIILSKYWWSFYGTIAKNKQHTNTHTHTHTHMHKNKKSYMAVVLTLTNFMHFFGHKIWETTNTHAQKAQKDWWLTDYATRWALKTSQCSTSSVYVCVFSLTVFVMFHKLCICMRIFTMCIFTDCLCNVPQALYMYAYFHWLSL